MKQLLYGVKLMYRYMVGGEVYYEESVLRVRASSFEMRWKRRRNMPTV